MIAAVLVVPNFVDIPIHFVMVATAFFAIIAGAHKSMVQTAEAERTGERKVRALSSPRHRVDLAMLICTRAPHGHLPLRSLVWPRQLAGQAAATPAASS